MLNLAVNGEEMQEPPNSNIGQICVVKYGYNNVMLIEVNFGERKYTPLWFIPARRIWL